MPATLRAMEHDDLPSTWAVSPEGKALAYVVAIMIGLLGLAFTIGAAAEGDYASAATFALSMVVAVPTAAIWYVHRVKVVCEPDGLEITSTMRRRKVGWHEIARAESGYYGVVVVLKNGRRLLAGAVQKSNASTWLDRQTRSDDLVDLINERVSGGS